MVRSSLCADRECQVRQGYRTIFVGKEQDISVVRGSFKIRTPESTTRWGCRNDRGNGGCSAPLWATYVRRSFRSISGAACQHHPRRRLRHRYAMMWCRLRAMLCGDQRRVNVLENRISRGSTEPKTRNRSTASRLAKTKLVLSCGGAHGLRR